MKVGEVVEVRKTRSNDTMLVWWYYYVLMLWYIYLYTCLWWRYFYIKC